MNRHHRTICYIRVGSDTVRLTSEAIDTEAAANQLLDQLLALPNVTGGDIETYVPGIGWVMGGNDEAESAVIIARRQEHTEACKEFEDIVGRPRSDA